MTDAAFRGCALCPFACGCDRTGGIVGRCGQTAAVRVARAAPHFWEEPCISGTRGSGCVFFSGCGLRCCFCQNATVSHGGFGQTLSTDGLTDLFLSLAAGGVHNLNLVTATHFRPAVQQALADARARGLSLPVVWNTGGYETTETIDALASDVDIWLFDLKFYDPGLAAALCGAPDYFSVASAALLRALEHCGPPVFDDDGLLRRGLILRLLVLPGHRGDAVQILRWVADHLPRDGFLLSLMRQYTPPKDPLPRAGLNRPLTDYEYRRVADVALALGFENGFFQDRGCAEPGYTPPFDLTGLPDTEVPR